MQIPPTQAVALSIQDAVKITSLSRSTLYRMMDAGDLPTVKIGTRRLIRRADLDALLNPEKEAL